MLVYQTNSANQRIEYNTKESIELACMPENTKIFSQSNGTPFLTPQFLNDFGYEGNADSVNDLLLGTYTPPPGTNLYAKKIIEELRMAEITRHTRKISILLSTQEHRLGWRKIKEATASESTDLLFGHFKTGTHNLVVSDFDATLRNIPYYTGYSPKPWQVGTDVEL